MTARKNSWIRRIIAAGMAAGLVMNTTLPSLAESVTAEYKSQEMADSSLADGDLTEAVQADQTGTAANGAENGGTDALPVSAETAETQSQADDADPVETEAQSEHSESAETEKQTETDAQEPQEVQLALQLLEVENVDGQSPSLTLAGAASKYLSVDEDTKTINITDGPGLILLSNVMPKEYCSGYTINLITTTGWDVTRSIEFDSKAYEFLGLGNEDNPYKGRFRVDTDTSSSQYSITTARALFNNLSTDAVFESTIPFMISADSSSNKPLLTENLKKGTDNTSLICKIELREPTSNVSDGKIGGLIGTMEANTSADISFENAFESDLTVNGEAHTGLFCNTMKSGASLTATYTNTKSSQITVEATASDADAGGFVGHMEDGTLTIAGSSVAQVTSTYGNAGGLAGSVDGGVIQIKDEENTNTSFIFADSLALKAGSDKAAGGLIGEYTVANSETTEYDLSGYQFPETGKEIEISGGKNVGGVFGLLKNTSENAAVVLSQNPMKGINVKVSDTVTNLGGLIGSYQAANLASSLRIAGEADPFINVASIGGGKASASYGGVIGEVSDSSYVEIENVSVSTKDMNNSEKTRFGGLAGTVNDGLLDVGSITLTTNNYDISANNVDGHGGLVGYLVKGVLRLHGKTDLSGQRITTAYNHVGQIVGNNGDGLVYALGNGNDLSDNGDGWSLIRYSNDDDRGGSDIGNWGTVVRLGDNLTEDTDGAFTFDSDAHTIMVNNGTGAAISNANAFVAYALAFDISNIYKDGKSALRFKNTVDPTVTQRVVLTGNVNLTNTGVIGIGKDNTEKGASAQTFTGSFDGGGYTVTLDIGRTYGAGISESKNAAGQLYAKRSDQQDTHYSLALIPFAADVTVQDLTIDGSVNGKVPKTVSQTDDESDVRYPAFISAAIGLASGETTFNKVTVNTEISVTEEEGAKKLLVWQSGFLGRCEGTKLSFGDCTWGEASLTDERVTDNSRMGGLAAEVMGGCTVTVKNSVISGSITAGAEKNAYVGGLIAVSEGENENGDSTNTINISGLQVKGEKITVTASGTSGGLLGYKWRDTDVTFAKSGTGVTISGSTLSAKNAQFGGLVYLATGYWNVTAKDSIVFTADENSFTGQSTQDAPSGLLIGKGYITESVRVEENNVETVPSALYLEMGTWGSDGNAAYKIGGDTVSLSLKGSEYFDELVGITKYDDARDRNAVVSIAVRDENGIDSTKNNTYTYQTGTHYNNSKTRYYYNLDAYRESKGVDFETVTDAKSLVLWSVSQYAANTIKKYFWTKANQTGPKTEDKPTDVTISGTIDLKGYSYYPVTPLGTVTLSNTSLKFDNETIETLEKDNKKPSELEYQHYLMHHGLLYNTNYSVYVDDVIFSGTVGKESVSEADNENTYNSGALIFGTVAGDLTKNPVELSLSNVTLAGIRVIDIQKGSTGYAPLLINKIDRAVKLTVDTLSTGAGYTIGDDSNKTTYYAATSLIGNVGSKDATKLTLSFSNIALDGRIEKDSSLSETVQNNGDKEVNYQTTHTIFTRATLLEKFQYVPAEGSGVYNFNSTDTMVTYGVELTNTADTTGLTGRNPDKQYEYYNGGYITDETTTEEKNADYVKKRYAASNFIRYVYNQENSNENLFELDINQRATGLLDGCGTYGDPYIITNGEQLIWLASYISAPTKVNDFQVVFNSKVLQNKKQTSESYHNEGGATSDATGSDVTYKWENSKWLDLENAEQNAAFTTTATQYLLNAYYEITTDIEISSADYAGLGTMENPFSGVIVGHNLKTVNISCTGNRLGFGGLIAYSRGSVVKDLILDYSETSITMSSSDYPGSNNNYPFFGGVVGYCMGGDTIIDQVSVKYTGATIDFSGTNEMICLIPAGGYVGLVGGASSTKYTDGYEKNGGGVVFRNMSQASNTFAAACAGASASNKTVTDEGSATEGGQYFYRNPYVGRVLDGYVCSENDALINTDKNYTIPTLHPGTDTLVVDKGTNSLKVTVNSAPSLWLLSAIVNSGAGAMSSDGTYADVYNEIVDAYQVGKPRTASYKDIGKEAGENKDAYLADEKYWGGVASTSGSDDAKNRVSYLVKKYTADTNAAYLAGKSSSADTNIPVALTFSTDIDVSSYGNGFRGIGSSYGNNMGAWNRSYAIPKVYRRNLLIRSINAGNTEDTTVTLSMNQNDYYDEYKNGFWRNQGAGLFVDFHFVNNSTVNHLKISGNVKVGSFKTDGTLTYLDKFVDKEYVDSNNEGYEREEDIGVGGFAARTANSWGKVTFSNFHLADLSVYGGTSTGGAFGYADYDKNDKRNEEMIVFGATETNDYQPWSISNVKVLESVNNNGSSGGLIGWYESGRMLKITGYGSSSEQQNISSLSVKTVAQGVNVATAGGLVGAADFGSVTVDGVNATEVNVSGENLRDIGGLIAGARQYGTIAIKNCVLTSLSVSSSKNEQWNQGGVGGILGYHEVKPVTISGVVIRGDSSVSGLNCVGGFVGRSNQIITIENCKESETNISAAWSDAGGFIGSVKNVATIKNVEQDKVNILAAKNIGGLIGNMDGSGSASISNVETSDVMAVTRANANCAGMLVGYANNKTVNGYNILASNCKTGYSATGNLTVLNLSTAELQTTSTCGFWVGESIKGDGATTTDGVINLVAVSANGNVYPQCDVGTKSGGTVSVVYADKSAAQIYKPSSSALPWVDVNPKSDVEFKDDTIMTGNGIGMTDDETIVAKNILQEINTTKADRYWNLTESTVSTDETYKTFSQFLDTTNDAYITTYRAEEGTNTEVKSEIDFPILVINNSAEVDTMLWNYIAAMTNVSTGKEVKGQIKDIKATTYKWNSNANNFAAQPTASLNVNATSKRITIVPNAYDNMSSQFTLLDVTYTNPVDKTAEFHLYIPVLVKKVLYIWFKTRFIAGTDYCASDYPMDNMDTEHYATAGFDEPLTAYIEYTYDQDTDWQSMLDNGEKLMWSYDKILDLAYRSTAETGRTLLPAGTLLTLIDRQTKQYYTYTTTGTEDVHNFNLAQMQAPDGKGTFEPVTICDLLKLTVSGPVTEEAEGVTYYVEVSNQSEATVKVGEKYYRKAMESDTEANKYSIAVAKNSEAQSEGYYLTIQIPSTAGVSIVNNRLNYAQLPRKEGTLPASIKTETDSSGVSTSSSGYPVYQGVEQTLKVSTSRIHNRSDMDSDTVMENGDSIKITLESTLKLTEEGKAQFGKIGPAEVYHQFDINLKKYLTDNSWKYTAIGTEMVDYTYTLAGNGLSETQSGRLQNAAGQETITIHYGGSDLKSALEKAVNDENAVTVTAEITLTYQLADYFPQRNTSDSSDNSGISVVAVSRIANTESQLPITENKKSEENGKCYYIANLSKANLTYSAVDGAGTGDTTQQLGINPIDEKNNLYNIDTRADYDYSGVDALVLKDAKKIQYRLELFQKMEDGLYNEANPLQIAGYLQNTSMDNADLVSSDKSYQWTKVFESNDMKHEFARIHFTPLTGDAFEKSGYMYANYKVRLTAVLLNDSGAEIDGTKASDYIIYTNARIYQEILGALQNTADGNE